ncbi:STAS/SEC14 domain-containing protein [Rhodobacterales bacterium HKCCE2091]|nr:STAS/SEC14 domain-containing protein [Rhodobacterales bacterium HKCCE2091]
MIELMDSGRGDRLEFRIAGKVTERDYREVLIPAFEAAEAEYDHVRMLVVFDGFEGYEPGAMLEDARLGLKHWNGFDRVAVVSEPGWITRLIAAFSVVMPCPVMTFGPGEETEARRWLEESLGAVHQSDLGGGVLHVSLIGKLEATAYEGEAEDMNAFIRANDRFRLLLDLREFDGWQGLGAIGRHLSLVRDHRMLPDRVAIVGTNEFQRLAQKVGRQFLSGEVRYYDAGEFEAAKAWLAEA